jgi:hypothetical protein
MILRGGLLLSVLVLSECCNITCKLSVFVQGALYEIITLKVKQCHMKWLLFSN